MKNKVVCLMLGCLLLSPSGVFAAKFGLIDAQKIFAQFSETQKTKEYLESKKGKLQEELESKKAALDKLDKEYLAIAEQMQELRSKKKENEARALEPKLGELRQALAKQSEELQQFFETSQRSLYALEEQEMHSLSEVLEKRVDELTAKIAKERGITAVFEKKVTYYVDPKEVEDITEEIIKRLNALK